jgi:succinyl-CoA synthetase alpha subunit
VRVVGSKAKEVFAQYLKAMRQKDAKVIASFVIGDIQPKDKQYDRKAKSKCQATHKSG